LRARSIATPVAEPERNSVLIEKSGRTDEVAADFRKELVN